MMRPILTANAMIAMVAVALVTTTAAAATGNKAHDVLVALPADQQAKALGQVVGEGCVGKLPFFMGMAPDNKAFWSIRCTNGKSYMVQLNSDVGGSTQILDCPTLKAVSRLDCFVKLSDQKR